MALSGKPKLVAPLTKERGSREAKEKAATINRTCEDEIALIADYLSSSLNPRFLRLFEKHLDGCRDCNAYLKTIEVTRAFLKS
jgi:hypothetical protein